MEVVARRVGLWGRRVDREELQNTKCRTSAWNDRKKGVWTALPSGHQDQHAGDAHQKEHGLAQTSTHLCVALGQLHRNIARAAAHIYCQLLAAVTGLPAQRDRSKVVDALVDLQCARRTEMLCIHIRNLNSAGSAGSAHSATLCEQQEEVQKAAFSCTRTTNQQFGFMPG